jgi:hypothetical protein
VAEQPVRQLLLFTGATNSHLPQNSVTNQLSSAIGFHGETPEPPAPERGNADYAPHEDSLVKDNFVYGCDGCTVEGTFLIRADLCRFVEE